MIPDVIYISGPITDPLTGKPMKGWKERFNGIEKHLQKQGFTTISPVAIAETMDEEHARAAAKEEHPVTPPERCDYMMADLRIMKKAYDDGTLAGILMLDGWETSDGAQCEYHFARSMGVPVFSWSDHGYQLNSRRVPYAPLSGLCDILKWHTLAELAAVVRNDPEEIKRRPQIAELRRYLEQQ